MQKKILWCIIAGVLVAAMQLVFWHAGHEPKPVMYVLCAAAFIGQTTLMLGVVFINSRWSGSLAMGGLVLLFCAFIIPPVIKLLQL